MIPTRVLGQAPNILGKRRGGVGVGVGPVSSERHCAGGGNTAEAASSSSMFRSSAQTPTPHGALQERAGLRPALGCWEVGRVQILSLPPDRWPHVTLTLISRGLEGGRKLQGQSQGACACVMCGWVWAVERAGRVCMGKHGCRVWLQSVVGVSGGVVGECEAVSVYKVCSVQGVGRCSALF